MTATVTYDERTVAVGIVAFYGPRLPDVVAEVEVAVRPFIGSRELRVTIEDLDIYPFSP